MNTIQVLVVVSFLGAVRGSSHVYWDRADDYRTELPTNVVGNVSFDYVSRQFAPHINTTWVCPNESPDGPQLDDWVETAFRTWKDKRGSTPGYHVIDMEFWRPVWHRLWGVMEVYKRVCVESAWTTSSVEVLAAPILKIMAEDGKYATGYYDIFTHKFRPTPEDEYIRLILGGIPMFHSMYLTEGSAVCDPAYNRAKAYFGKGGTPVIPVISPFFRHSTSSKLVPDPADYARQLQNKCGVHGDVVVWTSSSDRIDRHLLDWLKLFAEAW